MVEHTIGTGAGGYGGFLFTPDELDSVLAKWERLHADLREDGRQIAALTSIEGPGDEQASENSAGRANDSGSSFMRHHDRMVEAVGDYIDRLKASRLNYLTRDESAEHMFAGQLARLS